MLYNFVLCLAHEKFNVWIKAIPYSKFLTELGKKNGRAFFA